MENSSCQDLTCQRVSANVDAVHRIENDACKEYPDLTNGGFRLVFLIFFILHFLLPDVVLYH
jgi:hypothetical protein